MAIRNEALHCQPLHVAEEKGGKGDFALSRLLSDRFLSFLSLAGRLSWHP
jgi:hypothetical protein